MTRRLVIAVDCDDVLMPSSEAIVRYYNRVYGTSIEVGQFYDEDPVLWGVKDREEKYDRVREYFRSDEFLREVQPFKEAVQAVQDLARRHELHLVTGRSQTVDMVTHAMVDKYFKQMFLSIEHTGSVKQSDGTIVRRTKGEVCKAIHADILIDDNLEHAKNVLEAGTKHVILYGDYGWNATEQELTGAVRCSTWDDVMKRIEEVEREA